MAFRVTQGMLSQNMLHHLNSNLQRMQRYQEQLSTERRINRPSDDPVGINFSLRYRSELRTNAQYADNLAQAEAWLAETESLMNGVNDIMQQAYALAIQGANDTNSDGSRESIAQQIDELLTHVQDLANSKFRGNYVFNGEKTNAPPYEFGDDGLPTAEVDQHKIVLQIGPGAEIEINVTGDEVFGPVEGDNLFGILAGLSSALRGDGQETIDEFIGKLDARMDAFLETMASVGARTNRVELATERLKDNEYNVTKLLSHTEDVDIAEAITHLKMAEYVYIQSLSVGARILQPSLLDFLR